MSELGKIEGNICYRKNVEMIKFRLSIPISGTLSTTTAFRW